MHKSDSLDDGSEQEHVEQSDDNGSDNGKKKMTNKPEEPSKKLKKEKSEIGKKQSAVKEKEVKGAKEPKETKEDKENREKSDNGKSDGLGDKVLFLLQIARRAQNLLGSCIALADVLERYVSI